MSHSRLFFIGSLLAPAEILPGRSSGNPNGIDIVLETRKVLQRAIREYLARQSILPIGILKGRGVTAPPETKQLKLLVPASRDCQSALPVPPRGQIEFHSLFRDILYIENSETGDSLRFQASKAPKKKSTTEGIF